MQECVVKVVLVQYLMTTEPRKNANNSELWPDHSGQKIKPEIDGNFCLFMMQINQFGMS